MPVRVTCPSCATQLNIKGVTVKGEFSSFSDGTISLNRCWLVP